MMLARKSLGLAELPHPLSSQGVQGSWPMGLVPAHLLAAGLALGRQGRPHPVVF